MNLRSVALHTIGATAILACVGVNANAQVKSNARATSATHASAEMTKGKLNPSETKPGDKVALQLKNDVKSNGDVVLKKGTTITGVVRSVKSVEAKGKSSGQAQSMMEIEWFAPAVQGKAAQQLSIALQSVTQVNRFYDQRQAEGSDDFGFSGGAAVPVAARPSGGGGLLGGAVATVGGAVGATADVAGTAGTVTRTTTQSNAALLNMPSVVAVDNQTASNLESNFGTSSSSPLFRVGRGELVSAGGSKQSVELFSHLSNDTMITSPSKDFEISSGAQMQLLVGVSKQ
jgi:hypothetical protein